MAPEDRFDRSERLFGAEGQRRIRATTFAVAGCGGLGTAVIQQLALLGAGGLKFIDPEQASNSNRNRYVGLYHDDPLPGLWKVDLAHRLAASIDPAIKLERVRGDLLSTEGFDAIKRSDLVVACFDDDGPRFVLNELCLAYSKPLIDLASDVPEPGKYGGRVVVVGDGPGCLFCRVGLSQTEIRRFLSPQSAKANEDAVYGVAADALSNVGPSVVYLNGVIASLGVQEAAAIVTGLRQPISHLEYRGHEGVVRRREPMSSQECPSCSLRGLGPRANVERYISAGEVLDVAS